MKFLQKLKKTILDSFFGKPERSAKRSPKPKKKKTAKRRKIKKISFFKKKPVRKKKKVLPQKSKVKTQPKKGLPSRAPAPAKIKKASASAKSKQLAPAPKDSKKAEIPGALVGTVTHFFTQVKAAAIKIEAQNLSVGDEIYFKGATTNFKHKIVSMQINRVPVTQASKGAEIGILVKKRVREGDEVYKL